MRELENVIQRAIILSNGPTLSLGEAWLPPLEPAADRRERHAGRGRAPAHRACAARRPVADRGRRRRGAGARHEAQHPAQPDGEAGHRPRLPERRGGRAPSPHPNQAGQRERTSSSTSTGSSRSRIRMPLKIWNSRDSKKASARGGRLPLRRERERVGIVGVDEQAAAPAAGACRMRSTMSSTALRTLPACGVARGN